MLAARPLFASEPKAHGYLRPRAGYRVFERRAGLVGRLMADVKNNREWLPDTLRYPLARK